MVGSGAERAKRNRVAARKLWIAAGSCALVGVAAAVGLRQLERGSEIVLAPEELDLGRVAIGAHAKGVVVATNVSERRLRVVPRPVDGPFGLAQAAFELAPGESRALTVGFQPTERGSAVATLTLSADALELRLPVRGAGYRPAEIELFPTSIAFGDVAVGATSEGLVTIRNPGDDPLEIRSFHLERPFAVGSVEPSVAPGETINISVSYAPRRARRDEGRLWIESSDPNRPEVGLHLRGSGRPAPPRPSIETDVGALDFGAVAVCGSRERSVEISNRGADTLTLVSVTSVAPFFAPTRGFKIAPGGAVRLPVAFAPTGEGPTLAPLLLHSNDPTSGVIALSLLGEGRGSGECPGRAPPALELEVVRGGGVVGRRVAAAGASRPGGEDAASAQQEPESVATGAEPTPIRDGSMVRLSSYTKRVTTENVSAARFDPATGELALAGVELPVIELPLGQYFEFEPTDASGRVNALGDADLVLPVEMRDENGNPTRVEIALTTGTTVTVASDGRLLTFTGEPFDAAGDGTLVGLATLPSGGLEGALLRIVLNVHVEP